MAARGESTRARVRDRKCGYYYWHWTELDEGTFLGYAGPYPDIPLDTPLFVPLRTIKCLSQILHYLHDDRSHMLSAQKHALNLKPKPELPLVYHQDKLVAW